MRFRGRRFLLNPSGVQSTAAVVAEIEDTRNWLTGRFRLGKPLHFDDETAWALSPDLTLKFSDCTRSVNFEIEWDSPKKRRAARQKVALMVEALTEFGVALEEEQRLYVQRLRAARLAGPPPEEDKEDKP